MTNDSHDPQTHFGFQSISKAEKTHLVANVFARVAKSYDLMNDVMSFGVHRYWKNELINLMRPRSDVQVLDVAGGTGDIAVKFLQKCQERVAENVRVTVCDRNVDMINQGRDKAINQGMINGLEWTVGDAENLPLRSNFFDIYTIAFGLRNVTEPERALNEAWRVLKPGGIFFCLEFSKVNHPLLKKLYDFYSFSVIPRMGQVIADDRAAYQYLVESIEKFPDAVALESMLKAAGFQQTSYQIYTFGVVAIHIGVK